jgi:hypothetical protein
MGDETGLLALSPTTVMPAYVLGVHHKGVPVVHAEGAQPTMMRVPFTAGRRHAGVEVSRRQARDPRQLIETLTWAGASFFMAYLAVAAVLGFFTG